MGSLTANIGFTLPTVGGDTGPLWGQELNGDFAIADAVLGGTNSLNVGGAANVTLTTTQAQNLIQYFSGVLTGNITVFLPAVGRFYAIENATTGPFGLSVGCTGGGNAQQIPQGLSTWIWTDGNFTRLSNPPGWQEIATYIVSGAASQTVQLPAPFRRFRVTFQNVFFSTNGASLQVLGSVNGGTTSLSPYVYTTFNNRADGTTLAGGSESATSMPVTGASTVNTPNPWDGTMDIYPGSSTRGFFIRGNSFGVNTTPVWTQVQFAGSSITAGAINALALFAGGVASSGTFSGTIIVEGLP